MAREVVFYAFFYWQLVIELCAAEMSSYTSFFSLLFGKLKTRHSENLWANDTKQIRDEKEMKIEIKVAHPPHFPLFPFN